MKKGFYLTLLVALLLASFSLVETPRAVQAQAGRQVWAVYMGWWTGDAWGGRAGVLSDHPARGNYDSRDGGTAGGQIDEAMSAGIDAFIVTWFGVSDQVVTTPTLNNLLDQAAPRGFHVAASVDVFQPDFNRNRDEMINSLRYLVGDRANHPAYLRYNGKPVIFFAFQERTGFSDADWQDIRNQVDPGRGTLWIAEGLSGCCIHGGAFDGMYTFNVAWAGSPASIDRREMNAARSRGGFYFPTAHPGWNEDLIVAAEGRPNPTSPRDRAGGAFLTNSWNGAVATGSEVIIIVSWNEFVENSHVEPSQVFGTQSLDVLRGLIAAWKGSAAPAAPSAPATTSTTTTAAPSGLVAIPTVSRLNVRAAPASSAARLGQVTLGNRYSILGRNGDSSWWLVDYGGGQGWIAAQYARYEGGDINAVPVTDAAGGAAAPSAGASNAVPTGIVVTATSNVRIRNAPGTQGAILGTFPWQGQAELVGRNGDNSWLMINYNGTVGWVSAAYASVGGDVNAAPVTG